MTLRRVLLVLVWWRCLVPCLAEDGAMPIIAYWGVPDHQTTVKDFQTFSECGFSVSLYPYSSLESLVKACQTAERCGVKVLGRCPEMFDAPAKTARTLSRERGFYGYFLKDEPTAPELDELQSTIKKIKAVDGDHRVYVNLLPCQQATDEWVARVVKARTYPDYLKAAASMSCEQISFDHYPVLKSGLRDTWYYNLEMVRRESLASGKPFWGFVLSVPHADYPQPTMASLRLQAYSNLAYGAQAIQYFTYWTPVGNTDFDFHDAPIAEDGRKTATYALVQSMNKELAEVAKLFYGASIVSVGHLGVIEQGTTRLARTPLNVASLKVKGRRGAVVSQFVNGGHTYLAVVNKDYQKRLVLQVKLKNSQPRRLTKLLQEEAVKSNYSIPAGDILLFRLQ